jgi:uncharacterized membrane protein
VTGGAQGTPAAAPPRIVNASLAGAIVCLAAWVLLAFVFPVGSGWVHLLMAAGVILLIRRVVTGPGAW